MQIVEAKERDFVIPLLPKDLPPGVRHSTGMLALHVTAAAHRESACMINYDAYVNKCMNKFLCGDMDVNSVHEIEFTFLRQLHSCWPGVYNHLMSGVVFAMLHAGSDTNTPVQAFAHACSVTRHHLQRHLAEYHSAHRAGRELCRDAAHP